jgi:hypothetical protein
LHSTHSPRRAAAHHHFCSPHTAVPRSLSDNRFSLRASKQKHLRDVYFGTHHPRDGPPRIQDVDCDSHGKVCRHRRHAQPRTCHLHHASLYTHGEDRRRYFQQPSETLSGCHAHTKRIPEQPISSHISADHEEEEIHRTKCRRRRRCECTEVEIVYSYILIRSQNATYVRASHEDDGHAPKSLDQTGPRTRQMCVRPI